MQMLVGSLRETHGRMDPSRARIHHVTHPLAPGLDRPVSGDLRGAVFHSKHYHVTGLLGEGGMGKVYRAWDPVLERDVALKVIKPDVPGLARERFRREAVFGARLSHPGLARVYDLGLLVDQGLDWFAMEYLHGKDLEVLLARARRKKMRLSPRLVAILFDRALEALHHAHEHGVVHRDVKPANVFLIPRGGADLGAKLLDFGIAWDVASTAPPEICGDPRYVAPEQADGDPKLDRRADVYSAGITLFESLVGRHPFEEIVDAEPESLIEAHRLRSLPSTADLLPSSVPREVRRALDAVVAKACAKDPAKRFATADALRRALLAAVAA